MNGHPALDTPPIVSAPEWEAAPQQLLVKEKELTHDGDRVFRTYFVNNRGDEAMGGTWSYLDITALGRQEQWEDSPEGYPQTPPYEWWNWHDEYAEAEATDEEWLRRIETSGQSRHHEPTRPGATA